MPIIQGRRGVREPTHTDCYPGSREAIHAQLRHYFTCPLGPGLPEPTRPDGRLCAALVPHIDYFRGGVAYAWGYKELVERTQASLFVIVATSHYSGCRFILTRQDFETTLGVMPTDQHYIDRLVHHYGPGLFEDEEAHIPEHSIELEVVFLQYLYEMRRPIRIVPLLVGSFQDTVRFGLQPRMVDEVERMIRALREVERELAEPICYLISGDLAHIGPKFGDRMPVKSDGLRQSRRQDEALLQQTERADAAGYYRVIAEEQDRRRICGFPPTYVVLEAIRPREGKTLSYDQYVHPSGQESVSFASVGFYGE